jgi:hypothetical protein
VPAGESEPAWAWLESAGAYLMLARADEPVVANQQAVLFYLYCDDVAVTRGRNRALRSRGRRGSHTPSTLRAESSGCTTRTGTF